MVQRLGSKKLRWTLALLLSIGLAFLSTNAHSEYHWEEFLRHPNDENLTKLTAETRSLATPCEGAITPSSAQQHSLFNLIEAGNELAFRAALVVFQCWDGGDAEDFDRSAGVFFEHSPRIFLEVVTNSDVSPDQLRRMITMLPLETVDNIDAKLSRIESRISKLQSIDNPKLADAKNVGLAALTREKKELMKIKL